MSKERYQNRQFAKFAKAMRKANINFGLKMSIMALTHQDLCCTKDLNERMSWHKGIAKLAENGTIAVVWSGMDCDCSAFENDVWIVPADWRSIEEHIHDRYKWADGPIGYFLQKPSIAKALHRSSRDLALEAFEDGHPHLIYYGSEK